MEGQTKRVAPSSACIDGVKKKVQLTEADGGERRSLHDGSMPVQQVSRASLCHLLNLKGEEEESRSQPPPF